MNNDGRISIRLPSDKVSARQWRDFKHHCIEQEEPVGHAIARLILTELGGNGNGDGEKPQS